MKFRHELKHYINYFDYIIISNRLKQIMENDSYADENGEYKVRSLYFDNYNDKVLKEKLNGVNHRDKYRIRLYNDDSSFIRLEKKSKINGLCKKISSRISKEEVKLILDGNIDFLNTKENLLFNELFEKMSKELLKPKKTVWITGEEAQLEELKNEAIKTGELILLNQELLPGCTLHRSAVNDVARVEDRTFICTSKEEDAGPNNNWKAPNEMYEKLTPLFDGVMKERTMYIIPYSMGPIDSPSITLSASRPPTPIAITPRASTIGVCESVPTRVSG